MIGTPTRTRKIRARPVGDEGQLAYGGYWSLEYSQNAPYEVRLVSPGPYRIEVTFARDILRSALRGQPDGHGDVQARLEYVPHVRHSMVLLTVSLPDYQEVLALDDKAVASGLHDTTLLVPFGKEPEFLPDLDAGIATILGNAA